MCLTRAKYVSYFQTREKNLLYTCPSTFCIRQVKYRHGVHMDVSCYLGFRKSIFVHLFFPYFHPPIILIVMYPRSRDQRTIGLQKQLTKVPLQLHHLLCKALSYFLVGDRLKNYNCSVEVCMYSKAIIYDPKSIESVTAS